MEDDGFLSDIGVCGGSPRWGDRRGDGRRDGGCEVAVVDPGPGVEHTWACFTKLKWQTLGDSLVFNLSYILASCQITSFAKLILANSWRCSKERPGV